MSKIRNLEAEYIEVKGTIDGNVVSGERFEGLPLANTEQLGVVKIDNETIKLNSNGQIYSLATSNGSGYDDEFIIEHISSTNIHLGLSQSNIINESNEHLFNSEVHLNPTIKDKIEKSSEHILKTGIHLTQDNSNNIIASVNHINNNESHVSINDRDSINSINTHIGNDDIHITKSEKDKIPTISTHINNNNVHMSTDDRESINGLLSLSSTIPDHLNNKEAHFLALEKATVLKDISDNKNAIIDIDVESLRSRMNDLSINKLDAKNHTVNKLLITDNTGSIVYHPTIAANAISTIGHKHVKSEITDFPTIPIVTNDLTDELKLNYNTAYSHSQATHAPSTAEQNVQSDWSVTDTTSDSFIKNKPTIPTIPSSLPANGGDADTIGGKTIFIQQTQPTTTKVGDVWITW